MVPYHHWIGAENGMGEDHRWMEPGRQYFQWTARHDRHFTNKRSIANLGVVMGQRTHLFYKPPRGATAQQYMDGMYYALLEGRFLFDFVHEDKLAPEDLKKYSALMLAQYRAPQRRAVPAIARLRGCRRLAAGHLRNQHVQRAQPSAARISAWPTSSASTRRGTYRAPRQCLSSAHREAACDSRRLHQYQLDSRRGKPLARRAGGWPVLTVVPGFAAYPPELSYPPSATARMNRPWCCGKKARAGWLYFPGDIERTMWRSGHTDLAACCGTPSAGSRARTRRSPSKAMA